MVPEHFSLIHPKPSFPDFQLTVFPTWALEIQFEVLPPSFYAKIISDSFGVLSQRATGKQNEPYYERNTGITAAL